MSSATPFATLENTDFLEAAQNLLPRGRAWPRDPKAVLTRYLGAIADCCYALHRDIVHFFDVECDPSQADDMLPEWQEMFGITARGTPVQQRAQLVALETDPGGFSIAHYEALALGALGIAITPVATAAFVWEVHAAAALSLDDRTALEALINLHNRASCVVSFIYDL
jgi:uncharacterized protein YmfQ (DUF2313 family)